MSWSWGDSFDLYAAAADMITGYWDSGAGTPTFVAGRFTGNALQVAATAVSLAKSSATNDAVHHLVVAFRQTAAISGTTLGAYLQLLDGSTAQCSVVFRSDGAILLTSGGPAGTVLATYAGAFPVTNTWYAFEIEVVINNTTGSFKVRKNGNSVDDHSTTGINTRGGTANNYANSLKLGMQAAVVAQQFDDLFWQSSASAGTWLGDIRCFTRMPENDQSVQFSKASSPHTPGVVGATAVVSNTIAHYTPLIPTVSGTLGSLTIQFSAGFTGNLKCTLFNGTATTVTTIVASATTLVNPATGTNTIVFPSPPTVLEGNNYWVGFIADVASGNYQITSSPIGYRSTTTYAAFPSANPSSLSPNGVPFTTMAITPTINASLVNEAQQDALASYVYSSNPGDADLYGIASIASTPANVIATTVRAYMQKSDAGTRTAAVQLKSGATTVASSTLTLSSSGWLWAWRMDLVDPATGAAWTPSAVNSAQVGPKCVA